MIGVAVSVYRLWCQVRFAQIKEPLEARLERPYFLAAVGKGAVCGAFDAAFFAEGATARGEVVASTLADLSQFYENVAEHEVVSGGFLCGVPIQLALLTSHMYRGKRVLSLRGAVATGIFLVDPSWPGVLSRWSG